MSGLRPASASESSLRGHRNATGSRPRASFLAFSCALALPVAPLHFLLPKAQHESAGSQVSPQISSRSLASRPQRAAPKDRRSHRRDLFAGGHGSPVLCIGALALFALAPWLSGHRSLDQARGIKKGPPPDAPTSKVVGDSPRRKLYQPPLLVKPFRERLREVTPYRDIVSAVVDKFLGKGGAHKQHRHEGWVKNHPEEVKRMGGKPVQTNLDKAADVLGSSGVYLHAKVRIQDTHKHPEPDPKIPEVCFIGRSNVGKSSLMNRITQWGTIAKVSAAPGTTRELHWFRNQKVSVDIIDMPGYGYAENGRVFGPDTIKFVQERKSLKVCYILIDARHGFKRSDHEWLHEIGSTGPVKQVILTKTDLVSPDELVKTASVVRADLEQHKRMAQKLIMVSARHWQGIHDIRADICNHIKRPISLFKQKRDFEDKVLRPDLPTRRLPPQQLGSVFDPDSASRSETLAGLPDAALNKVPKGKGMQVKEPVDGKEDLQKASATPAVSSVLKLVSQGRNMGHATVPQRKNTK